jgi:hypothetical protein
VAECIGHRRQAILVGARPAAEHATSNSAHAISTLGPDPSLRPPTYAAAARHRRVRRFGAAKGGRLGLRTRSRHPGHNRNCRRLNRGGYEYLDQMRARLSEGLLKGARQLFCGVDATRWDAEPDAEINEI